MYVKRNLPSPCRKAAQRRERYSAVCDRGAAVLTTRFALDIRISWVYIMRVEKEGTIGSDG